MRQFNSMPWLLVLLLATAVGCANGKMALQGQLQQQEVQQLAVANQRNQLQQRTEGLDRDNQELSTLLAQSQQQTKLLADRLAAANDELRDVTTQLGDTRRDATSNENRVRALTASMQRRGGVTITPNNSLLRTMPTIDLPNVPVRRDGDVIRIELAAYQIFEPGSARLRSGAVSIVRSVAAGVRATYPDQIIGVEGHTDNDPVVGGQWRNNHELSVARSVAVYDILRSQAQFQSEQLFLVGHGANHPIASNGTPEGKRRNRRVELVIYPEKR